MDLDVHKVLDWKEKFTGCTLHHVTEVDGGQIVYKSN